jgi:segregation and condensation protein B
VFFRAERLNNVLMYRFCETPGRQLGSVALRYRQPLRARTGLGINSRASRRWLFADEIIEEVLCGTGSYARNGPLARLEAVLVLAREPLGSRKLAQLAGLADGTEARTLVRTLNQLYDAEGTAFRVEEVAGGFHLMTRPQFAAWLRRLHSAPVEIRLSSPAMETLAVVAYQQPVLRAEIEAIRGVQCGELLRQLIERDLVRIVGRSEELGRPLLYGTTRHFLLVFGLRQLDELPRAEQLRVAGPKANTEEMTPAIVAEPATRTSDQPNHSCEAEEETDRENLSDH